jgi:hypothetical protein
MNKKYCTRHVPIAVVPVFALVPVFEAMVRGAFDLYILAEMLVNFLLGLGVFVVARRQVARIEEGKLFLLSGIGEADEDSIDLASITAVDRVKPRYMTIRYGEGKALGLESDKAVLNELAKDLAIFVGKKPEAAALTQPSATQQ